MLFSSPIFENLLYYFKDLGERKVFKVLFIMSKRTDNEGHAKDGADRARVVAIAMDESDQAKYAYQCKFCFEKF